MVRREGVNALNNKLSRVNLQKIYIVRRCTILSSNMEAIIVLYCIALFKTYTLSKLETCISTFSHTPYIFIHLSACEQTLKLACTHGKPSLPPGQFNNNACQ